MLLCLFIGNQVSIKLQIYVFSGCVLHTVSIKETNLYTAIDKQMQSNSLRSRYSIYNDKEMTSQYTSYTKTIAEWETKISDKEDYYYKKFSKMETALSKLNSQTSSLSGMFSS